MAEYLKRWLADYAKHNLRAPNLEDYADRVRLHLVPHLGSIRLDHLRPAHIQQFYSYELTQGNLKTGKGLAPNTVRKLHAILSEALEQAVKWGILARNPCKQVNAPSKRKSTKGTLTWEQVLEFLDILPPLYHTPIFLAIHTGMRASEILELRWKDLDLDMAVAYVSRRTVRLKRGGWDTDRPKSDAGLRPVALTPASCAMLRGHRERQQAEMQEGERPQ